MRKDKTFILIIFGAAILGVVYVQFLAGPGGTVKTPPARPAAGTQPFTPCDYRGISLQFHGWDPQNTYAKLITEISQSGANMVCLVATAYMENAGSSSIFIEARKIPPFEQMKKLIAHAHSLGLKVALMPIVLMENPREGEWRGKINPSNWDKWWQDYNYYMMHYAWLAQETGVDLFILGSELISTETQTDRWRSLIKQAREAYRGKLTYSSNWDHYTVVKFWDDLDMVGMTTYYDLTGGKEPTVELMMNSWLPHKQKILDWQKTAGKPILFTEVGWPNQVTCAQYPWNYYAAPDKPQPKYQADCFEAFFRTFVGEPGIAGFLVWEWRSSVDQAVSPDKDTSYCPYGKPAMDVISSYYRMLGGTASGPASQTGSGPSSRPDSQSASRPATQPAGHP
ncbi:MAG: hypothetical protein HZA50_07235 [Planctomycetes bacterium]|nr:hypothetical protein [Planctomycetota bacterium]